MKNKKPFVSVHRFGDAAALAICDHAGTLYITEKEARRLSRALLECARDMRARRFVESQFKTTTIHTEGKTL